MAWKHSILFTIALMGWVAALGLAARAHTSNNDRPSTAQIAFAEEVSNLMLNELVAALFTEFDETTVANVPHGKQAISLIFNDRNRDMRLIGTFAPLLGGANDRPDDRFERTALRRALDGDGSTAVEQENDTWYYRRSVPLSNAMHTACVMCHTNFTAELFEDNPDQWVGALVLRVPIGTSGGQQ